MWLILLEFLNNKLVFALNVRNQHANTDARLLPAPHDIVVVYWRQRHTRLGPPSPSLYGHSGHGLTHDTESYASMALQAVFAINDLASSTRARANLSVLSHTKRAPTPYTPYGMSLHTQISTLTGRVGTHHTTTETHTERDTK